MLNFLPFPVLYTRLEVSSMKSAVYFTELERGLSVTVSEESECFWSGGWFWTARGRFLAVLLAIVLGFFAPQIHAQAGPQDPPQVLQDRITSLLSAGQMDAAVEEARQVVVQYPNSSRAYTLLGTALGKKALEERRLVYPVRRGTGTRKCFGDFV